MAEVKTSWKMVISFIITFGDTSTETITNFSNASLSLTNMFQLKN